jgi:hypothetical protein
LVILDFFAPDSRRFRSTTAARPAISSPPSHGEARKMSLTCSTTSLTAKHPPGGAARIAAVIAPISLKSKFYCRTGIQTCETSARSVGESSMLVTNLGCSPHFKQR